MFIKSILAALFVSLFTNLSYAAVKIDNIEYVGNQRISSETIFAYLKIDKGDEYSKEKIDQSIKSLFNTGFFSDVKIDANGSKLIISVKENPLISNVYFEGNKRIEDSDLKQEIRLKSNSVFSNTKMHSDIRRMTSLYHKRGRYSVAIEPKLIQLDQNRINLIYEINEGTQAKIKKINFYGNKNYSSADLKDVLASKEYRWYRFFSSADVYDSDKLEFDKEQIRRFYQNRGYAEFKITSATTELSPKGDAFIITFVLDEGQVYKFGDIAIKSKIPGINEADLIKRLTIKSGKKFDKEKVNNSVDNLYNYLGEHGYPFVDIDPNIQINKTNLEANIAFNIKESVKVYVNNINIKNNTRTLEKVIRREFRIAEGDPYNITKIQRSKQRIENLGFFNKVAFKNIKTSHPDKVDIDVEVEETSTGSMNFAAGFSTSSGPLASVSLTENNFLGKGQQLSLGTVYAKKQTNYTFSFTEPYFIGKDLSAGIDLFVTEKDQEEESSFRSKSKGGVLRFVYDIKEHLTHALRYTLKNEEIFDVKEDASLYIKLQKGKNTLSSVGQTLVYDKLDSRITPKEGYLLKFNQDFAGLGGQINYISHEVTAAYYYPVHKKDFILKLLGRAGTISGWGGKNVRISDRFMLGPDYIRGFDISGIGPRDKKTGDALGGNNYYAGTAELQIPTGLSEETGLNAAIFFDMASLFGIDEKDKKNLYNSSAIRSSTGVSFMWTSPFGLIGLHYGVPLQKEKFDRERNFYFNFGTNF